MPRSEEYKAKKREYDRNYRKRHGKTSFGLTKEKERKQNELYLSMIDDPDFIAMFHNNKKRDKRTCLKCMKKFKSEHYGNRICGECAIKNRKVGIKATDLYSVEETCDQL